MKKRILAWSAIVIIPLLYVISIVLSLMQHPFSGAFLMIVLLSTMIVPMTLYSVTTLPKHLAEWVGKILEFHKKQE